MVLEGRERYEDEVRWTFCGTGIDTVRIPPPGLENGEGEWAPAREGNPRPPPPLPERLFAPIPLLGAVSLNRFNSDLSS